jgi:Group II intron, maturase-specific domain
MPQDAPPNGSARVPAWDRVAGMQAKLHRWAAADPGRRFDDLFNLVHDPATLMAAFGRVAGNQGANTPGVDGVTAEYVEQVVGVPGFLDDLRAALKDGSFRPLPVRERMIPEPGGSGKLRRLGIPAIADRVVQAALKLALSALDEHLTAPWKNGGTMSTEYRRAARRRKGLPTWRIVRYADDFAVLINGSGHDAEALREQIAGVLAGPGLRFSEAKTRVTHMSEGFSFLGFRIKWRRKRGTSKHYVCTFIDDRPVRSLKAKIRALTPRTSQLDLEYVLTRLNQVMRGWANYFRHAVAKDTFGMLDYFAWWRVIRMLMERHHWRWKDVRRWLVSPTGSWRPISAGETELRPIAAIPVTRYRYRGSQIPSPWTAEPA